MRPRAETTVDVWRMVPGVTEVKLTGSDGLNPWPRGPNVTGGYQLDGRILTLQDQALGALLNHAEIQNPPPQRLLDDLSAFQRVLFTNERVRALSEAIDAGLPLPDADPPLNAFELQGKAIFARACGAVPRWPGAIDRAGTGGAHARHLHAVPAARGYRFSGALQLRSVSATAGAQRAYLRNHIDERHQRCDEPARIPGAHC